MPFAVGEPVPWFYGPTQINPRFRFDSVAGRYTVLSLFGSAGRVDSRAMLDGLAKARTRFDDVQALFFGVTIDPDDDRLQRVRDQIPGIRFFRDFDQTISRLFGALPGGPGPKAAGAFAGDSVPSARAQAPDSATVAAALMEYQPFSLILDERLRVLAYCRFDEPALHIDRILSFLGWQPAIPAPARASVQAPVLVVPRVFEPDFCKRLIDLYERDGGEDSGFMRDEGGKTVGVIDYSHKRRSDYTIEDEVIRSQCLHRIHDRLIPEIYKAYQFRATRMERYIVACYESTTGGHFKAHRDNTTKGTAHRRFAVSLNLNAENFQGGDLRFPEFGQQLYKPPTGGAVVLSCSLLHEATPVTSGIRYVFLPFLYDDAAARVREENVRFLAGTVSHPQGSVLPTA
ncbi:MAG: 2OG-Fe(II) oxygenase [Planctomycetota bacterium]|nr:2OG-Fe(II) oxygenase [Planctomycetota bacterium]